ncbi:Uncharacterized membrane protein [Chitinophaga sp. CF118]|uniref:anthrone oxygenase family protein n=1 Tax=Chitinophaga sp. CF118 TaxID=1884367 RepID=UPI0008EF01E3|nr:anthrone oxygenase family protein [Chitinophaga sp. CF118]SFD23589.1 Uncharacterized membrane protein [Chitinophaga sp. CF118]
MNIQHILLISATITTALIAGLFFGFVVAINPAFAHLPDAQYITAMQAINKAIINPAFAAAFFGAAVLIPLAAWKNNNHILMWLAAAFYLIGGIGITFVVNVPLNNILEVFPVLTASPIEAAHARRAFDKPWNTWHLFRTLAIIISLLLLIISCILPDNKIHI